MRLKFNRILCFLLILGLVASCIPEFVVPVEAANYPDTHPNKYANTGNQRADIVGVALTQVGYQEGEGNNNYTKYGAWWGRNPMAWCAIFVSWCAEQAGVPHSVIQKNSFSNASAFGFSSSFTAYQRTPQPGDLFFRNGNAHTGIVYKVEGDTFYTLEGNTWTSANSRHGVMIRQRDLYSSQYTFVSPNYQGSSNSGGSTGCSHSYVKGSDTDHPHKEYYKCSQCGYSYYTGTTKKVDGCQDCCSHQFGSFQKSDDTYHGAQCSLCGKTDKLKHNWGNDEIIQEANCKDPGLKTQECADCGATRETQIPATENHEYGDWLFSDSHNHYRICQICETEEEAEHTLSDWKASAEDHWYECADCKGRLSIGSHMISGDCSNSCVVCDLTPNSGHMYSAKWTSDALTHWYRCVHCSKTKDEEPHVYSADCDETCDTCGYVRQVNHTYGSTWESDSSGHWRRCEKCGQKDTVQAHKPGKQATETQAQLCTLCSFEIVPVQKHSHSYTYTYDGSSHWGACSCGAVLAAENHVWQMDAGKCEICQAEQPATELTPVVFGVKLPALLKSQWLWQVILFAGAGIVGLVILIMVVAAIRRRVRYSAAMALRREFEEEDALEETEAPDTEEIPEQEPAPV